MGGTCPPHIKRKKGKFKKEQKVHETHGSCVLNSNSQLQALIVWAGTEGADQSGRSKEENRNDFFDITKVIFEKTTVV